MLIPCSRVRAVVTDPEICLERSGPGFMVWDEHGGTYVLRVDDLEATEGVVPEGEAGIFLEIPLSRAEELRRGLEKFAAEQQLPLAAAPGPELLEEAVLAACHLPAHNLFVFAEAPNLTAKRRGDAVELSVAGTFKARRLPCRETDLVIHLTKPAMARLVGLVLSLVRVGA